MKLPIPSFFSKKEKPEFLLALLLRDEKASAVILEQLGGTLRVITKNEEYFTTSLEDASEDEWLNILDKTISKAEETLPSNVETHKTVFGVKETWVDDKRIKKEYLLKLKKACEVLELTPIGFLVITEAISHYLQKEEGAPITAIIAEIGMKNVSISLIKAGRVIETHNNVIEESTPATVDTMLKSFTSTETLPARIIIFNGDQGEEHAQQFIAHQWSKSLPFLHVPQITILPSGFDAKAVVFGAATQMELEVMTSPVIGRQDAKTFSPVNANEEIPSDEKKIAQEIDSKNPDGEKKILSTVSAQHFGFVVDQDIAKEPIQEKVDEIPKKENEEKADAQVEKPTEQKFIINDPHHASSDVRNDNFTEVDSLKEELQKNEYIKQQVTNEDILAEQPEKKKAAFGILSPIGSIMKAIRLPSLSFFSRGGKLIFILPVILVVLIGAVALYIYALKATVLISIQPKSVDQNADVVFTQGSGNDFGSGIIQASDESVSLDGNLSAPVTGKKEIGDKAKGTITLFNSDSGKKQLGSGTVITSSNGLEFTLDKDVSVASASGDIFTGIKSGTTQAAVTAKQIGQEYNLPSGTKFSVSGTNVIAAKNDSAFSGGSKKVITVVAKKDIDKLSADLPKSLENKANDEIAKKISSGESFLPLFTDISLSKKVTDKDVNDEAKTVTLKATVTFSGLTYQDNDLMEYSKSLVKNKSSSDEQIPENGIKNAIKNIKKKSDKEISAQLLINTTLLPKIDENQLRKEIAGKSFDDAKTIITKFPHVADVTVTLNPQLPFLPQLLPRMSDNISFKLEQLHE